MRFRLGWVASAGEGAIGRSSFSPAKLRFQRQNGSASVRLPLATFGAREKVLAQVDSKNTQTYQQVCWDKEFQVQRLRPHSDRDFHCQLVVSSQWVDHKALIEDAVQIAHLVISPTIIRHSTQSSATIEGMFREADRRLPSVMVDVILHLTRPLDGCLAGGTVHTPRLSFALPPYESLLEQI